MSRAGDDDGAGEAEAPLGSLTGLRPEEKERLSLRIASLRSAIPSLRTAASGEEPLFAPELEKLP
jgi:hypothetical protein